MSSEYLEEVESFEEVGDVAAERFQRRVRVLRPHVGDAADEQVLGESLEVGRHHDEALDCLLQVLQAAANRLLQPAANSL